MKTLLAVRGVGNRGKSTSVKKAYELLKKAHPTAQVDGDDTRLDIKIVITIDGVKVGIGSQGDPTSRLPASLRYFVEIGCEVIICSTRTSGKTVDAVNALASQYVIRWFDKTKILGADEQESANQEAAHAIFAAAESAIAA